MASFNERREKTAKQIDRLQGFITALVYAVVVLVLAGIVIICGSLARMLLSFYQ